MGKEIRTRTVHRNVKTIDKAATAAQHMKHASVQIKERAEQTQEQKEHSPVEYAQNSLGYAEPLQVCLRQTCGRQGKNKRAENAERVSRGAAAQVKNQSGKAVNRAKERQRIKREEKQIQTELRGGRIPGQGERLSFSPEGGEKAYQPKEKMIKTAQSRAAWERAAGSGKNCLQQSTGQTIRTVEWGEKDIKTTRQTVQAKKFTGKGTVKTAGHSVKTAEQTAKTTIKTTEQAAKNAYRTAKTSRKTAEKAAKTAEKVTEKAVKAAAKTAVAAAKAAVAGTKALITAIAAGGWIAILVMVIVLLFGAALSMTGGDNATTVSSVSAEVQAYEPLIRKYAKQYGIGEYVELIKAVMMQESGGQGSDPMQSSEGSFNTKYPRKPNGITDPEYSIDCGVQEIKSCLASAEVKSPVDMDNIKLALQGYNYGNGYIQWAKTNYGGYTLANAAEFSDKMAKEKGRESYGDKQYVPHVLRYYSLGRIPNGTGNQAIVQVALAQEGNGGDTYWRWYGFTSRVSWCACFVSWCGEQCGYLESGAMPKFSLCSDGAKWFQEKGQFKDGSCVPAAGDIIFFDWGDDGSIDHVGIVESVGKGNVNTVEGNSGDQVKRHSYPIGDSRIYGYGVPVYIN